MNFMESMRGHILKFLWKQKQGAFLDMTLQDLKGKLVSRGSSATDFDAALAQLQAEGSISNNVLTNNGLDVMAAEYRVYLNECKNAAPTNRKSEYDANLVDFNTRQQSLGRP